MSACPSIAAGDALRLEKRTQLDQWDEYCKQRSTGHYEESVRHITVRDYGSGLVEVGFATPTLSKEITESDRAKRKKQREEDRELESEQTRSNNLDRSLRRTRAQVRRKCLAGGLDHMLTITHKENITDAKKGYEHLSKFVRLIRKKYPDYKYVAVLERQKRGSIHFHMAVKGFQDVKFLRKCWQRVTDGQIDVQRPKLKGLTVWKRARLAGYLVKYVTKEMSTEFARQRYRVSEGIEIPKHSVILRFPVGYDFLGEIFDSLGVSMSFLWTAEKDKHGWACSW